jgi:AAA domain
VYSLTGQTGHAKTAVALLIAQLVSSTQEFAALGVHRVEKGRVVCLVGENPDDSRMRLIGADAFRGDNPDKDRISFIPCVFNIAGMYGRIVAEVTNLGGVDLVIIDTSAAYFLGNDEISNTQMGAHARMLRTLTQLPGGPCVLVLCHPIKHTTDPTQLLPRGGGAFLAEMDGNLTIWRRDDVLVELHYNKIRGPGFEPMTFKLEKITSPKLTDKKGRLLPTVRAVLISESEEEKQAQHTRTDEDALLAALLKEPDRSIAELARACNWTLQNGEPHKSKVYRFLEKLSKGKPKLVTKNRDRWALTEAGKSAARKASLAIERAGERP